MAELKSIIFSLKQLQPALADIYRLQMKWIRIHCIQTWRMFIHCCYIFAY